MKTIRFLVWSWGILLAGSLFGQGEHGITTDHHEREHVHAKRQNSPYSDSTMLFHFKQAEIQDPVVVNRFTRQFVSTVGGTASGLLGRVSGSTLQNGMAAFRGLSPRYTTVTINGLSAPVTEQNIKAFSLGLLPPDAIQAMDVYKGGYYGNYGEWGSAVVNITSTADIKEDYLTLSGGMSFQRNFTFEDFVKPTSHNDDFAEFFGYGLNDNKLIDKLPAREVIQNATRNEAAAIGAQLPNNFPIETVTAAPGFDIGIGFGKIFSDDGKRKFSTSNSLIFSRMQKGVAFNRARYNQYTRAEDGTEDFLGTVIESTNTSFLTDGIYTDEAKLEATSQWFYRFNPDHEINLALEYGHDNSMTSLVRYFVGIRSDVDVFGFSHGNLTKEMFLARLNGSHRLFGNLDVGWTLGTATFDRDEPDLRRAGAQRPLGLTGTDEPYIFIIPESSKADAGARFASDMDDNTLAGRLDLSWDLATNVQIKGGVLYDRLERDFVARLATAAKDDNTAGFLRQPALRTLDTVFAPNHFGPNGYFLVDGSSSRDDYNGENETFGVYIGTDFTLGPNFNFSIGGRIEDFSQNLTTDVAIDNNITEFLPTIAVAYTTGKLAIKGGYSRSLNHPAFRELSPFTFYDYDYRADISGNPNLQSAKIDNFDLTFEVLFGNNEYFAVTPFAKRIEDPIEMIYRLRAESPLFSFDNAKEARLGGVEVEFAKFLGQGPGWRNILLSGNFNYTSSVIELPEDSDEFVEERQLQGQVPILANGAITYFSNDKKTTATIAYRYVGRSLFSVGDGNETFPWYEMPRNYLNASFSHRFGALKITVAGTNLLNTRFAQFEDANTDGRIDNPATDKEVQRGLAYQTFNLGFSYDF